MHLFAELENCRSVESVECLSLQEPVGEAPGSWWPRYGTCGHLPLIKSLAVTTRNEDKPQTWWFDYPKLTLSRSVIQTVLEFEGAPNQYVSMRHAHLRILLTVAPMSFPRPAKRNVDSTTRSVSPPAARRRKVHVSDPENHVVAENTSKPPLDVIKIVSWNVNGVGPFFQRRIDAVHVYSLRSRLQSHGWPQLCCLQEVKINSKDLVTQRRLQAAANEGSLPGQPAYEVVFSLPRDPHNAKGFGGKVHGVASLVRHDFLSNITITRRPDWDLEGRFLIHETSINLIIIAGYWVNGSDAPWRNPSGKPEGTRHDLKLRYHARILDEVLRYEQQKKHVLLIGDMNVALDVRDGYPNLRTSPFQHVKNRQDFNQKFFADGCGMQGVDVFRHCHGDQRKYTYYSSGRVWGHSCDQVDYIIASRRLIDSSAIVDADICDTKSDAAHSDHVPLWVTINPEKLQDHQGCADSLEDQKLNMPNDFESGK